MRVLFAASVSVLTLLALGNLPFPTDPHAARPGIHTAATPGAAATRLGPPQTGACAQVVPCTVM
ncbi:hypothetical protein [Rhodovulum sp. PH10]|uniref:hypothetical protein n=1 Tax=Rhodovulum sp. PH10 TaxID=1187851 RepID=UPI0012FA80DF|nr:hypothetical protein [Rhodovulum sp. PH10]